MARPLRILLVLPTATYRALDFLAAARELGAEVVVASEEEQTMAGAMGGRAVTVDLCDPRSAARAARELHPPPDAVVGVDEQGVLAAAHAAGALGRPHNPPGAVELTRDKERLRRTLTEAGLPQPRFAVVRPGDDAVFVRGTSYVVKAPSLSGSRGVIRADDPDAVVEAERRVRAILDDAGEDPDGAVLVEDYVPGAEVALEGLLVSGRLQVLAVFDKPDPLEGPYFEETIYLTPSRLPSAVHQEVVDTVRLACEAVGLVEGPIHAEVRLPEGRPPVLLEVAARSIGGLCSRALRFGAGISLEEVILRHALGMRIEDLRRTGEASGVMMLPIRRSGVLTEVGGLDEAKAVGGVVGVEITIPVGQRVRALPEGDRYLGFAFATGGTPERVEAALRAAEDRLRVVVEPDR